VTTRSSQLFARAQKCIPGGVNSPVRAFRNVDGEPFFVARAEGAKIWDVDGKEYIDYVGSWGPAILGHAPKVVVDVVREAATRGLSFGIPNPLEVEMAELICDWVPSIERVRMVNSGTEAAMSCIRLARAFTRRDKIIKFENGKWRAHPWSAEQCRCPASVCRSHNFVAVQQCRLGQEDVSGKQKPNRGSHSRADSGERRPSLSQRKISVCPARRMHKKRRALDF